ncbi:MAG: putative lipid II flippase FtsW [Patescibacteria group bacterium]|nr:putative lipid II flippase FtsW [Patescibacteria group bacterium]
MGKEDRRPDYILITVVSSLIIFGIIILASASSYFSQQRYGDPYLLLRNQLLFALLPGILLAFLISKISLSSLKKRAPILLLISLFLMAMVFFPNIGIKAGSAARWISLGLISFQPSEFLKLTLIIYIASWLESKNKKTLLSKRKFKENFIAFLIIIALISLILVLQSDISTLAVILAIAALLYFFAETPLSHTVFTILLFIIGLFIFINFTTYRSDRISVFLNPETDPLGIGYQIEQSKIAVGSGSIYGLGPGMSQQKLGLLPHPISDSIFAILAEETGFLGSTVLILLFLLFLWRGYKIGKESTNTFSRLTALGITSWILIQAFINIGAMIGILPLTGIPLPFISHGGSALVAELAAVGVLINISKG